VWFGRITAEKAPHLGIAAARLARKPLVLAGPIADRHYFATQVAPHLDDEIRYAGHLGQDELARLIGSAQAALITPMWDEPYGLVIAEAMGCGTPVVAFARGGIPELVVPQSGRLVAPGDVAAMARAVPEVMRLPRGQVREHAERHCSSAAMVDAYLGLYRQMIELHSEVSHDRLLHPPSRLRACGAGDEHLRTTAPAGNGAEFGGDSRTPSVRGRREATA
jgi:glycosyltransferase involved in cell wall biosynthesis